MALLPITVTLLAYETKRPRLSP